MAKEIIFYNSAKTEQLFPMTEISSVVDSETGVTVREYLNEIDIKIRNIEQTGSGSIDISKYYTKDEVDSQNASQDTTISELSDRIDNLEDKDIDLSGYYTKTEIDNLESSQNIYIQGLDEKIGNLEEETNTTNSLQSQAISELDSRVKALEEAPSVDISGKQDIITDLEDIREGASLGKTALQSIPSEYITESELGSSLNGKQDTLISGSSIKTINGESILGSGNIEIKGGTDVDLSGYYTKTEVDNLNNSQDTTISGLDSRIKTLEDNPVDLSDYYTKSEIDTKNNSQDTTISGLDSRIQVLEEEEVDLSGYYDKGEVDSKLSTKQNTLISGSSIKTINGESILGSGDITIEVDTDSARVVELTRAEYDALTTYEPDVIYIITDEDIEYLKEDNLKTINGQSLIGSGDIVIEAGSGTVDLSGYYTKTEVDGLNQAQDTTISGLESRVKTLEDNPVDLSDYYNKSEIDSLNQLQNDTITDIDNRLRPLEDKFSGVDLEETYYTKNDVDIIIQGQDTLITGIDTRVKALEEEEVDLSDYYTKSEVNTELGKKQDTLVSGTSIKTINGTSILGSGNITIEAAGEPIDLSGYYTKTEVDNLNNSQDTTISGLDSRIKTLEDNPVDLSEYYKKSEVNEALGDKQDTLVSGTSIKTINGESILGSGDITIEAGSSDGLKMVTLTNEEYKALDSYDSNTVYIVTDKKSVNLRVSELEYASYYSLNWYNPDEVISGYKIGDDGLLVSNSTSMITGFIDLNWSRNMLYNEDIPVLMVVNTNGTNQMKRYRFLDADMNPVGIPNLSGQETTSMYGSYNEGNGGYYSIEYPIYAKYVQLEITSDTGIYVGNHADFTDYTTVSGFSGYPEYKKDSFSSTYALIKNLEQRIKALEG